MTPFNPRLARLALLGLSTLLAEQGSPALALDARNIALSLLTEPERQAEEGEPETEAEVPLTALSRPLDEDEDDEDLPPALLVLDTSTPEGLAQLQRLIEEPEQERLTRSEPVEIAEALEQQDPEPSLSEVSALFNQDVHELQRKADALKDAMSPRPSRANRPLSEDRLHDIAASSRDQARPPLTPPSQRPPLSDEDRMKSRALADERILRIRSRTSLDTPYSSVVPTREGRVVTGSPVAARVVTPPVHNVMFLGTSSQVPQYLDDEQDPSLPSLFFDRIESELLAGLDGGPYPPLFRAFFEDPAYRTHKRALCQVVSSINLGLYPPSAIFPVLRAFEEFPASFLSQALSSDPRFEGSFSLQEDSAAAHAILSGFFQQIQDWVPRAEAPTPPPDTLAPQPLKRLLSMHGEVGAGVEVEPPPASGPPEVPYSEDSPSQD